MKKATFAIIATAIFTGFISCSKEKENPSTTGETPLKTSVENKLPADTLYQMPSGSATFGLKFHPTKSGNVTRLGCRMPVAGTYTVTLWDHASEAKLAEANVTVSDPSVFSYTAIPALTIVINTSYVISVNNTSGGTGQKYYQMYKKPSPVASIYPFTSGKIIIDEPLFRGGAASAFPDDNNPSDMPYLRGFPDFEFTEAM